MAKKLSIPELEARASSALADANEASERGDKAKADRLYEKAQHWLDRANYEKGDSDFDPTGRNTKLTA
jgi:outer membrane protein assembly factor BamD (BamD/ComL family)